MTLCLDNEEKISNKRKLNTPVKIEDAIKTETAVIEEVNESVKVGFFRCSCI